MSRKEILNAFGIHYNKTSFAGFDNLLNSKVEYEAHDCLYKVSSIKDVVKVLNGSIKDETSAFKGFFMYREIFVKHLTECVLICDNSSLKCIRIMHFKIKRGKIVKITGFNPDDYNFTRGKKIHE